MNDEQLPLIDNRDGDGDDDDDDDDRESTRNPFPTTSGRFPDGDGDMMEMTSTSKSRGAKGGKKAQTSFIDTDNAESRLKIMRTRQDEAWAEIK